jgi:uncharacterized protein
MTADPAVPPNVLLSGIVGSVAYGLNTEDSDVDRLGVFAAPTARLLGLHPPDPSIVSTKPDSTYHEAGKYCSLALRMNPTVIELLFLPPELVEVRTELGDALVSMRYKFLSRDLTRNAYLGYATQQMRRLETRGDGSFSADTRKRTAKHARHLWRLCAQCVTLWHEGYVTVRLSEEAAATCREFGQVVAEGDTGEARAMLARTGRLLDSSPGMLPAHPDSAKVEAWLQQVRRAHYTIGAVL